ncbi:MAG: tetratricopeptide repeat protein [Myxococcota bacterium]
MVRGWVLLVVALACLHPVAAGAAGKRSKARRSFQRAVELFESQRYDKALTLFERSHALRPDAVVLFNIGQTHQRLDHCNEAVRYYERFLAKVQSGPKSGLARQGISAYRGSAPASVEGAPAPTGDAPAPTKDPPAQIAAASESAQPAEAADASLDDMDFDFDDFDDLSAEQTMGPPEPWYRNMWLWTAAAGVVAIAAGSVVIAASVGGETRTVQPAGSLGQIDARTRLRR